jgi:hypothetical protein
VRFEKAFCRSPVQLFQTLDTPLNRFAHEIPQNVSASGLPPRICRHLTTSCEATPEEIPGMTV